MKCRLKCDFDVVKLTISYGLYYYSSLILQNKTFWAKEKLPIMIMMLYLTQQTKFLCRWFDAEKYFWTFYISRIYMDGRDSFILCKIAKASSFTALAVVIVVVLVILRLNVELKGFVWWNDKNEFCFIKKFLTWIPTLDIKKSRNMFS